MENVFSDLPQSIPLELTGVLVNSSSVRIERIISRGQTSPPEFWYDQSEHEWVLILSGQARLTFQEKGQTFEMRPGDHLHIPAHSRHRVDWTAPDETTVWLAVFYR